MARTIGKLTPAKVKNAAAPGIYGDGGGLWLNIGRTGAKSWLLRYMLNGRSREMGLGPLHTVGLAEARDRAQAARRLLLDGIDPLEAKHGEKARKTAAAVTFRKAAEAYVKAHRAAWRNEKHAWQWEQTLEAHAFPVIGELPVGAVDTGHVTKILEPIWTTKAETASRVRGRIEAVLDYAKTRGWRNGENPARWRGHLENALPARAKVAKVQHHPALPWQTIAGFMAELGEEDGTAALALRFTILTAARTNEVIGATWGEMDLSPPRTVTIGQDENGNPITMVEGALWTAPPERMKAQKEHRVPLSEPALAVLRQMSALRQSDAPDEPVFHGGKGGKGRGPLSNMAMLALLRRMGCGDLTVHGFRSTFRDWAAETTGYRREVVEAALAHTIDSKVEAAYRRGDLLTKRRELMDSWANYCTTPKQTEDAAGENMARVEATHLADVEGTDVISPREPATVE